MLFTRTLLACAIVAPVLARPLAAEPIDLPDAHLNVGPALAWAEPDGHDHAHGHHAGLHFTHPLVAESPSPDTKARFDYIYDNLAHGEGGEQTLGVELEYAFARWVSIAVEAPYVFRNPDEERSVDRLGNIELALKFANYAFEEHGVLIGGGVEFELPTGDAGKDIGSDHQYAVAPFIDAGWKVDIFEFVGFVTFEIPGNRNGEDEADWELAWNFSAMAHICRHAALLVELDGEHPFGGEEEGFDVISVTPGVEWFPTDDRRVLIGFGVRLPVTGDHESNVQTILSIMFHF